MPLAPDGSISGKFAQGYIGEDLVDGLVEWEFEEEADELDGTTGADEGFDNPDDGVAKGTVTMTVLLPVGSATYPRLKRGVLVEELYLYETDDFGVAAVYIPQGKVFRSKRQGRVKDRLQAQVTIKTKGRFYTDHVG